MTTYDCLIEPIAQSIFSSMFNIDLVVATDPLTSSTDNLRATVHISGEWQGRVLLELSPELAGAAVAEMLLLSAQNVADTDRREVTTELVNMIGGNIKSALPGPSFLSLPSIASEEEFTEHLLHAELIDDVTLISEHGMMRVRLTSTPE